MPSDVSVRGDLKRMHRSNKFKVQAGKEPIESNDIESHKAVQAARAVQSWFSYGRVQLCKQGRVEHYDINHIRGDKVSSQQVGFFQDEMVFLTSLNYLLAASFPRRDLEQCQAVKILSQQWTEKPKCGVKEQRMIRDSRRFASDVNGVFRRRNAGRWLTVHLRRDEVEASGLSLLSSAFASKVVLKSSLILQVRIYIFMYL